MTIAGFEVQLEVLVLGIITGFIYALLAMGLTLIYKSSRVINFAHGDMGALPAGLMAVAAVKWGFPYPLALGSAIAAAVLIGILIEFLVIRRLSKAPRLVVLVATIGAAQVLLGLNFLIPREDIGDAPFPTPFTATVSIGDLRLTSGQLMILALAPVVTVALAAFLRRSKIGLGSRAAAENLEAARLAGVPARRVSVTIWVLAALLSTAAAVLIGPTRPIDSVTVSLGPALMLRALAAALIGGMTSLPQVFAGGIAVGVIELLVSWNYPTGGVVEFTLFAVILASLLFHRHLGAVGRGAAESSWSLSGKLAELPPRLARHPKVRRARRGALVALLGVALLIAIPMQSAQRVLMSSVLLYALMGLSLVVLTGFAGQVSLGQFAFVALGAAVGGRMFQLDYPVWMGMLYATVGGGFTALLVGIPALRLRGLFLAVTTLGFAVAMGSWLIHQGWLVKVVGGVSSLEIPRQTWLGVDMGNEFNYYVLSLILLIAGAALVHRIRQSGLGRAFMAVRDNEPGAATFSVPPRRIKLVAFVISGMLASFAGYFYGGLLVNFTPGNDASIFAPEHSLALVVMVIFGGVTTVTGAILGALWILGIPYMLGSNFGVLSSGLGVLIMLQILPGGLASLAFRIRDRFASWLTGEPIELETSDRAAGIEREPLPAAPNGEASEADRPIVAKDVVVRFGGLVAVDRVSLHASGGEIIGLVGPNGAGKTTLFDVLSGQIQATSGQVFLEGVDVTPLRPEERARSGLGRTFQEARLFGDMPLIDTFKVALERHEPSETVPSMFGLPPSRRAEHRKQLRAEEILELLGLAPYERLNCSELSTGMRRFAELGCMLAMGCRTLLLDEPTAGIAQREVEVFTPVLKEVREHLGATMLIIDHDLPMITSLVDRLYVMAAGELIAEGDPEVLREDPAVAAAYLGADERAIQRSGHQPAERSGRAKTGKKTRSGRP